MQSPNSLQGAALAQGMMFVQRMRDRFADVPVTETHPKALLVALEMQEESAFWSYFSIRPTVARITEHERDALISAVAARQGFGQQRWTTDLSLSRYPSEQDPSRYWLAPVRYYWPHGEQGS